MKLKKWLWSILLALLVYSTAFGQRVLERSIDDIALFNDEFVVGNGGDGAKIGDNFYLLDFIEMGIENDPYFLLNETSRQDFVNRINQHFSFPVPAKKIAAKLEEIFSVSPVLAMSLLNAMELYSWRLVNYELVNVKDENTSFVGELKQIAIRKRSTILMNRNHWNALDEVNKVGLIFHEAVYALMNPKEVVRIPYNIFYAQYSSVAREINSYLFTRQFIVDGINGLSHVLGGPHYNSYLPYIGESKIETEGDNYFSINKKLYLTFRQEQEFEWSPGHVVINPFYEEELSVDGSENEMELKEKLQNLCRQKHRDVRKKRSLYASLRMDKISFSLDQYDTWKGPLFYLKWDQRDDVQFEGDGKNYEQDLYYGEVDTVCYNYMLAAVKKYFP